MKKFIFTLTIVMSYANVVMAQYDPLQQAYNNGYGMGMYNNGIRFLINNNFKKAFQTFWDGMEYYADNYEGVGICAELGFGAKVNTELALGAYKDGAKKGSYKCKAHLQRIEENGFWEPTEKNRSYFLNFLRAQYGQGGLSAPSYGGTVPNYNSGSGSSSSSRTCSACNGTGRCTGCHGEGYYWVDSGIYTGSGSKSRVSCGSCGGSGTCRVCYGRGVIR